MTPISCTIGDDRLVDEMIFRFTHTITWGCSREARCSWHLAFVVFTTSFLS
jgi:hypothetical protein